MWIYVHLNILININCTDCHYKIIFLIKSLANIRLYTIDITSQSYNYKATGKKCWRAYKGKNWTRQVLVSMPTIPHEVSMAYKSMTCIKCQGHHSRRFPDSHWQDCGKGSLGFIVNLQTKRENDDVMISTSHQGLCQQLMRGIRCGSYLP